MSYLKNYIRLRERIEGNFPVIFALVLYPVRPPIENLSYSPIAVEPQDFNKFFKFPFLLCFC